MTNKSKEVVKQEKELTKVNPNQNKPKTKPVVKRHPVEYTAEEYVANAEALGHRPEMVRVALHLANVTQCSKTKFEGIMKNFNK